MPVGVDFPFSSSKTCFTLRVVVRPEATVAIPEVVDGAAVFRLNWPNVIAEGPLNPSTYLIVISFGTYSDYL